MVKQPVKKVYTPQDVADAFGVSVKSVQRKFKSGAIPGFMSFNKWYLSAADFDKLIDGSLEV